MATRVTLRCNMCGEVFSVSPQDHISRQKNRYAGCPVCHEPGRKVSEAAMITWKKRLPERIETFKEKVHKKHGERYLYPYLLEEYKVYRSELSIICRECGTLFTMKADSHVSHKRYGGCKMCNEEAMKETIATKNRKRQARNLDERDMEKPYGCIYQIRCDTSGKSYIGYTTLAYQRRFKAHCDEAKYYDKKNGKADSYFHRAIMKYGKESFTIAPLLEFEGVTPLSLANVEKHLIKEYSPEYNVSAGGEIGNTYRKVS